jgi:hypothetical protein
MKSQRTFIVERKSGRRRSAMRPTSIWGDTDLKAFARNAEAQSEAHLFWPPNELDVRAVEIDECADPRPETVPSDILKSQSEIEVTVPSLRVETSQDTPFVYEAHEIAEMGGPLLPTEENPRRESKIPHANGLSGTPPERPSDIFSHHDLALLEQENQSLKRQLSNQLFEQNLQLRRMLARFGTT